MSAVSLTSIERGVWPAMLTPFTDDLSVDFKGLDHLVDFYIEKGVNGLLSSCWSSETEFLTFDELLKINRAVVKRAAGRIPVAATPHAGEKDNRTLQQRVRELFDTGVDYVVLVACRVAAADESEDILFDRLTALEGGRLGVYESPSPYHRLLSPDLMGRLARTGRFFFHKDTSCNIDSIRRKIAAVQGTQLCFYNAHSPSLLASLRAGGNGYCGIGANFYPQVYVELCRAVADDPARADQIQRFLDTAEPLAGTPEYPCNAKLYLQRVGVPVGTACRMPRTISEKGKAALDSLFAHCEELTRCVC